MIFRAFINGIFVVILSASAQVLAVGDIQQGKAKSITCVGCHGANGIAIVPNFPSLAGQKQLYLISAIESYQNGKRSDPTMKAMVAALSKTDIEDLAAFFASLPRK